MTRSLALKGRTFGRLRVIWKIEHGPSRWLCECSCGVQKVVSSGNLMAGKVQSCGCLRADRAKARAARTPSRFITGGKPPPSLSAVQRQNLSTRKVPVTLAPVKLPESEDVG